MSYEDRHDSRKDPTAECPDVPCGGWAMRTWTETHREGTKVGPINWSYDFSKHDWGNGHGGHNPALTPQCVADLRTINDALKAGKEVTVTCYGVQHKVLDCGMYDGWPYWEPTPSVLLDAFLGSEWHEFTSVHSPKCTAPRTAEGSPRE